MEGHIHTSRKVTINGCLRSFQYKILNDMLHLNKKLYTYGIKNYITIKLTLFSLLQNGRKDQFHACFTDCLHFSQLTTKTIFGFHNVDNDTFFT